MLPNRYMIKISDMKDLVDNLKGIVYLIKLEHCNSSHRDANIA